MRSGLRQASSTATSPTGSTGMSRASVEVASIASTASIPSTTWPKTVCLPSSQAPERGDDEELRAVRVGAGVRHRQRPADDLVVVDLVLERVAGAAGAGPLRAAALDHEVGDDPVEDRGRRRSRRRRACLKFSTVFGASSSNSSRATSPSLVFIVAVLIALRLLSAGRIDAARPSAAARLLKQPDLAEADRRARGGRRRHPQQDVAEDLVLSREVEAQARVARLVVLGRRDRGRRGAGRRLGVDRPASPSTTQSASSDFAGGLPPRAPSTRIVKPGVLVTSSRRLTDIDLPRSSR